jgi:hypothetical protein
MMTLRTPLLTVLGALALAACGGETTPEPTAIDGELDSFGGIALKADGIYSTCELVEMLKVVNESTSDVEAFKNMGLRGDSAGNLHAHRLGPDGAPGTADDDLFDDYDELDAVPFVGPATLDALAKHIDERCAHDPRLPFVSRGTFNGASSGGGWTRDSVELEATMTVAGVTGARLHAALFADDGTPEGFFDIRKNRVVEAFTLEYGADEMPWSKTEHEAREDFPYVALSVEPGRFELDPEDGRRELQLGTDIMDDTYFDTADYLLLQNAMTLRARVRWDDAESVRRILVAAKFGGGVDEEGIKRAAKLDTRSEGGTHAPTLDADVRRGLNRWSGGEKPFAAVQAVYEALLDRDVLPDIQGKKDVLVLRPQVHIRSTRSRYHMNEASVRAMRAFHEMGRARIQMARDAVRDALDAERLGDEKEAGEALRADADVLLDDTALAAELAAALNLPAADLPALLPGASAPTDVAGLEQRRKVAELLSARYHAFGEALDDLDREISGNDGEFDDLAEQFRWFVLSEEPALATKTTWDPLVERHAQRTADVATQRAAFNGFGEAQRAAGHEDFEDFEPLDEARWMGMGADLLREHLKISSRMIEGAGTGGLALWFDQARALYVPNSRRSTGNFLIDTIDVTEMMSEQEWRRLDDAQRKPGARVPPDTLFNTVLVNEVQIELGYEKPYLERIEALKAELAGGLGGSEVESYLAGARWVFGEYRNSLIYLAELKGARITRRLKSAGADDAKWAPASASKGETALRVLADMD